MYYKILCLIELTWLCSGINEIYMKNKNMLIEMKNWYTYFDIFFYQKNPVSVKPQSTKSPWKEKQSIFRVRW